MTLFRWARYVVDVVGTVGVLFAAYIVLGSAKDIWRYIRLSTM